MSCLELRFVNFFFVLNEYCIVLYCIFTSWQADRQPRADKRRTIRPTVRIPADGQPGPAHIAPSCRQTSVLMHW